MARPQILAAMASIPGRAHLLPRALASLRAHVDVLAVYLNGYGAVPEAVRRLADLHVLDPENRGAERKLHWAPTHDGIYLSCDDDFAYPDDYVPTMVSAVERWGGRAIVAAHGRVYNGRPATIQNVAPGSVGFFHGRVREGRWVNHAGTGVMAWDARRVRVPAEWPERNLADMQLAVWAQRERVPMWLIAHRAGWLHSFAAGDPNGIFRTSQREGHRRRNALLKTTEWKLFQVPA